MTDDEMLIVASGPVTQVVKRGDWIERDDAKYPWAAGPWDDEPDKVVWIDTATDLDCMVVRNYHGAWCGYVGVPDTHPYWGKFRDEIRDIDIHGGELTYAARCQPDDGVICHVPQPGRSDDIWWLGFDCGHYMDRSPGTDAYEATTPLGVFADNWERFGDEYADMRPTYKPMPYAMAQAAHLARQLKEMT